LGIFFEKAPESRFELHPTHGLYHDFYKMGDSSFAFRCFLIGCLHKSYRSGFVLTSVSLPLDDPVLRLFQISGNLNTLRLHWYDLLLIV
jgi:hypothetical protein